MPRGTHICAMWMAINENGQHATVHEVTGWEWEGVARGVEGWLHLLAGRIVFICKNCSVFACLIMAIDMQRVALAATTTTTATM